MDNQEKYSCAPVVLLLHYNIDCSQCLVLYIYGESGSNINLFMDGECRNLNFDNAQSLSNDTAMVKKFAVFH